MSGGSLDLSEGWCPLRAHDHVLTIHQSSGRRGYCQLTDSFFRMAGQGEPEQVTAEYVANRGWPPGWPGPL